MNEPIVCVKQGADAIELWRAMISSGEDLPIAMPVRGFSMYPLLKPERDSITVIPLRRKLIRGDIIVFQMSNGMYVVHRVRKFTDSFIETIGDNRLEPDPRFTHADVCGLVSHLHRKGCYIHVDNALWRCCGRIWMAWLPVRTVYRQKIRPKLVWLLRDTLGIRRHRK